MSYKIRRLTYTVRMKYGCDLFMNRIAGIYNPNFDFVTEGVPIKKQMTDKKYAIVYHGEIYNSKELTSMLLRKGCSFESNLEEEIILNGFSVYGTEFVKEINGVFAFAILDEKMKRLELFRDRLGAKPLFYTKQDETLIFSSDIDGIFEFSGMEARLDRKGLNEVFSVGPAKTYGSGVFRGIEEVIPGHRISYSENGIESSCYWKLESKEHTDSYRDTIEKTAYLVKDAVKRQFVSQVPVCTFLSGGLDSSLVSAICAEKCKETGTQLHTFSFDFVGSEEQFEANAFQPSRDRPYVEQMVDFLHTAHTYLECDSKMQAELLSTSIDAKGLPAMADVDSSLLYFCSKVSETHKVALTGECADEIFGGYPWFHKKECLEASTFPWTMDLAPRKALLSEEFLDALQMDAYVQETYEKSVAETPRLLGENKEEQRRREISYLNQKWFMQTLMDRMERTSSYAGLSARVPFADYRIVEYLWNVPWEMKAREGVVKSLLREVGKGLLPEHVLLRRKSPYPKTYDKQYEAVLVKWFRKIMQDSEEPIRAFLDPKKVETFLQSPSDYGKPWYGQLMAAPQMLAYLIQVNYWLKKYEVKIEL